MILNNWLFIEPFVHISLEKHKALLYNTLNGKALEYTDSKKNKIYKLVQSISMDENLLVVNIAQTDLMDTDIQKFVEEIRKNFMGDLISNHSNGEKPIQVKPIFNLQNNIETLRKSKDIGIGTKIMQNVFEITIYINNKCCLNCKNCKSYFKQFSFCTKRDIGEELDILCIEKFLKSLSSSSVQKINVSGGNIFKYNQFKKLIKLIENERRKINLYIHYKNILEDIDLVYLLNKDLILNILVDFPVDVYILKIIERKLSNNKNIKDYTFVVKNDSELMNIENIAIEANIENYSVQPYYNNKNKAFFKKNVFINKKDIFDAKPTMTTIYANQVINKIYFGRLNIMCDGNVFANLNTNVIGNIKINTLHEIASIEMDNGNSWRNTRNDVDPCKNCLYKYLCPPISNYEYQIGKFNLCTIY